MLKNPGETLAGVELGAGKPAMRAVLCSPAAAAVWAAAGIWALLVMVQALAGGPVHRTSAVQLRANEARFEGLVVGKIASNLNIDTWNAPLVRVWLEGRELPRYQSAPRLQTASATSCHVKGREILFRLAGSDASGVPLAHCTARVPILPTAVQLWTAAAVFLALTALLCAAGNPWLRFFPRSRVARAASPVLFAVVFAIALAVRVAGFSYPSWENDTTGYIAPALQVIAGQPVTPTERPYGYALAFGVVTAVCKNLAGMVAVQQGVTLLTGLVLAAVLCLAGNRMLRAGLFRALAAFAAILGFGYFTLHEAILQREWTLLPEAWAAIYMALQMALAWRIMTVRHPHWKLLSIFGVFCLAGWMIYFTKPNWGLAIGALPVPLIVSARWQSADRPDFWRRLGGGLAVFVGVSLSALVVQTRLTPRENNLISLEVRARVLLSWHAPLIRPEIDRRLAEHPEPRERALLEEVGGLIDEEMRLARRDGAGGYPLLGFDGDRLFYDGFDRATEYHRLSFPERIHFGTDLFLGALRRNPAMYARKVARQMSNLLRHPYAPGHIYMPGILRIVEHSGEVAGAPPPFLVEPERSRFAARIAAARATLDGPWPSPARAALRVRIAALTALLTNALGWAVGWPMLVTIAAALWPAWRAKIRWNEVAPALGIAVWATASVVGSALTSSLAQAMEIQRYIDLFMPMTLLAELMWPLIGLAIIWPAVQGARHRWRKARAG